MSRPAKPAWQHRAKGSKARGLGWEWQKKRLQILARDCGLCQPCKRNGLLVTAREVDHILPRSKGGTDDEDNLQSICRPCHKAKTDADEGRRPRQQIGLDGWPV